MSWLPEDAENSMDGADLGVEIEDKDVAVVGMAGRFPGARDLDELWHNLRHGVEAVTELTDGELAAAGVGAETRDDPTYVKAASLLDGVEEFDAEFFGYRPREAALMDPQQRLFLEHAWAALEDAGVDPRRFGGLVGIYAGVAWNTYLLSNLRSRPELFDGGGAFEIFIANDKDFMPTRASYKMDLKGPSLVVQTSCSTSLVAIHLAAMSLMGYECDLALAGGVTVKVPQRAGYHYLDGGLASPDGHCRPFDADAAGTIFGSGVGVVALKRLRDAVDDGDTIRAVIKGSAINNDGSVKVSYTAPSVEGQAEVIAAAQEVAGVGPESIGYVECHGTGTALGDPIEVAALSQVFRASTERRQFCALGSIKSNLGHLDAAAGVAGFLKAVLSLEHGEIPPSLNFRRPNPKIDFPSSPFFVASELAPWEAPAGERRRAGVSSFGVGGTNAHLVLEEAPPVPASAPGGAELVLPLSARSPEALERVRQRLADHLEAHPEQVLADVAHTLQEGRAVHRHRQVLVVSGDDDGRRRAAAILRGSEPGRLLAGVDTDEPRERPVVFLLPGQGAQHPGMGAGLYATEPVVRETLDRAVEVLWPVLGEDLLALIHPSASSDDEAAARLSATRVAQPALFALEVAVARLWEARGVTPAALVGHSVGELAAACLAGVIDFDTGLRLVAERGRLMDELPAGAMAAVPLSEHEVAPYLDALPELALAAINEPSRVVVSGPTGAIEELEERLARELGEERSARRLHTSHAFHSSMMEPAVEPFRQVVERLGGGRLQAPTVPFVSNVTGGWITAEEATDPAYWARQIRSPVRFAQGLETALGEGPAIVGGEAPLLLEAGPGRTLSTLAGRARTGGGALVVVPTLPHPRDRQGSDDGPSADRRSALEGLGRLWLAGRRVDWSGLDGAPGRRRVPLPTYPFERRRFWIDPRPEGAGATASGDGLPEEGPGKRPDPRDWFSLPSWTRTLEPAAGEIAPGRALLVGGGETAEVLAALLEEAGVRWLHLGPREPGHGGYRRVLEEWTADAAAGDDEEPLYLIHLRGLATGEDPRPEPSDEVARVAAGSTLYADCLALAQAVGETAAGRPVRWLLAATGLAAGPDGGAADPAAAAVLGLARVVPREVPGVLWRAVDLELPETGVRERRHALARRLFAELGDLCRGTVEGAGEDAALDDLVAYRGGRRWRRSFEPVTLPAPRPLAPGTYLVTGGLEAQGHAVASWLAERLGSDLSLGLLVRPAGDDERAERRRHLEETGARVAVHELDWNDPETVTRAVTAAVEELGRPVAVLHADGTLGERTFRALGDTGPEEIAWHFGPKAAGLLALDRALAAHGAVPETAVALGSLASVVGGMGYAAYAAAQCWLAALADSGAGSAGTALPWRVVELDAWRLAAGDDGITDVSAELAEIAMTPEEGATVLDLAFSALSGAPAEPRVTVSTVDLGRRLAGDRRQMARLAERTGGSATAHPRPALATPYRAPEGELEAKIAGVWRQVLGFEEIGLDDNFFELGGDSFVAVQVVSRLRKELGQEIPVAKLYQGLTVGTLAELLAEDDDAGTERRAAQLEERREAMDRRKRFQQRRRAKTRGADER